MPSSPDTLVIATGNPHKVAELREILAGSGLEVVGLADLPGPFEDPEETGETFEENAAIKALGYAEQTGLMCLADDSGLEVDALGGSPGVYSARYSADDGLVLPRDERDRANNEKLLRALEDVPPEHRTARFVCCMAVAGPTASQVMLTSRGTFEGRIGVSPDVPRGGNGFGYDPLFLVAPEHRVASAELEPAHKNRISHRAKAARSIAEQLPKLLGRR